ncbi:myeloid-derived growth factor-like [Lineus longissimus]|uniref:myeloid-derived growth factor-like n=1 Tax=Lineus longissimus TaxID=88925 RepID=UPI002B4E7E85
MEISAAAKFFCRKYMQNIAIFAVIIGLLSTHKALAEKQKDFDHDFEEFNVQPGGQEHSKERELNGVVCKFTYVAQGGTNEKWIITLTESAGMKKYYCSVSRPERNSYLFFMKFKLEIQGAKLGMGDASGAAGKPLKSEEYKVDHGKESGTVTSVEGKFQSQLTSVVIDAKGVKEEL